MVLQLPFRRNERFPALQQAKHLAESQAQQLVAAVEQYLPQRRVSFWARPFGRVLIAVAVAGTVLAAVAAVFLRRRDAVQGNSQELSLATNHTERYAAHRAASDTAPGNTGAADLDLVHEAAKESFPASDAPVFVSGPDVPIIRHGERKEELPYQDD